MIDNPKGTAFDELPVEADEIEGKIRSLIRHVVELEKETKDQDLEETAFLRKLYLEIIQICDSFERLFRRSIA